MRSDTLNSNSGKFGDMDSPVFRDWRQQVLRQSDDSDTAITLTVAQSGAIMLLDEDEAYAVTLPAITIGDIGVNYTFQETVVSDLDRTVNTAYDNDYFVGGVANLFDAAKTDGSTGGIAYLVTGGTDVQYTFDDNLANAQGGLGSWIKVTAILTGNITSGGGAKLVWSLQGIGIAQAETGTGAATLT
tara:strand:- start:224 stop:784 length:561 start_codon:yes stop_codon:yes gene_type:complete